MEILLNSGIDNPTILPYIDGEYEYAARISGDTEVLFNDPASTFGHLVAVRRDDKLIRFALQDADPSECVVQDNCIVYPEAFTDTDIYYTVSSGELKEDILLNTPEAPRTFTFLIENEGVTAQLNEDNSIDYLDSATGERVWSIQAPFAVDAAGMDVPVEMIFGEGVYSLTALTSAETAYPVRLDPTVTVTAVARQIGTVTSTLTNQGTSIILFKLGPYESKKSVFSQVKLRQENNYNIANSGVSYYEFTASNGSTVIGASRISYSNLTFITVPAEACYLKISLWANPVYNVRTTTATLYLDAYTLDSKRALYYGAASSLDAIGSAPFFPDSRFNINMPGSASPANIGKVVFNALPGDTFRSGAKSFTFSMSSYRVHTWSGSIQYFGSDGAALGDINTIAPLTSSGTSTRSVTVPVGATRMELSYSLVSGTTASGYISFTLEEPVRNSGTWRGHHFCSFTPAYSGAYRGSMDFTLYPYGVMRNFISENNAPWVESALHNFKEGVPTKLIIMRADTDTTTWNSSAAYVYKEPFINVADNVNFDLTRAVACSDEAVMDTTRELEAGQGSSFEDGMTADTLMSLVYEDNALFDAARSLITARSVTLGSGNYEYDSLQKVARTSRGVWYAVWRDSGRIRCSRSGDLVTWTSVDPPTTWTNVDPPGTTFTILGSPSIDIDSNDTVHLIWPNRNDINSIHSVRYRTFDGAAWSAVKALAGDNSSDEFYNPSIHADGQGILHATWRSWHAYDGSKWLEYRTSGDGGSTWSVPENIHSGDTFLESLCLDVSPTGTARAVWSGYDTTEVSTLGYAIRNSDGVWESLSHLMPSIPSYSQYSPMLNIGPDGTQHLIWLGRDAGSPSVHKVKFATSDDDGQSWSSWTDIAEAGDDFERHSITSNMDSEGRLHVVWIGNDGANQTARQAFQSVYDGASWSSPEKLTDEAGQVAIPALPRKFHLRMPLLFTQDDLAVKSVTIVSLFPASITDTTQSDMYRRLHASSSIGNDTYRRLYASSLAAGDTSRILHASHLAAGDTKRAITLSVEELIDAFRRITAASAKLFDSYRPVAVTSGSGSDTYRKLLAAVQAGRDTTRTLTVLDSESTDTERRIAAAQEELFDTYTRLVADSTSGSDAIRRLHAMDSSFMDTARRIQRLIETGQDTTRRTSTSQAGLFDSYRPVLLAASSAADTERYIIAAMAGLYDSHRPLLLGSSSSMDAARRIVKQEEAGQDTTRRITAALAELYDSRRPVLVTDSQISDAFRRLLAAAETDTDTYRALTSLDGSSMDTARRLLMENQTSADTARKTLVTSQAAMDTRRRTAVTDRTLTDTLRALGLEDSTLHDSARHLLKACETQRDATRRIVAASSTDYDSLRSLAAAMNMETDTVRSLLVSDEAYSDTQRDLIRRLFDVVASFDADRTLTVNDEVLMDTLRSLLNAGAVELTASFLADMMGVLRLRR